MAYSPGALLTQPLARPCPNPPVRSTPSRHCTPDTALSLSHVTTLAGVNPPPQPRHSARRCQSAPSATSAGRIQRPPGAAPSQHGGPHAPRPGSTAAATQPPPVTHSLTAARALRAHGRAALWLLDPWRSRRSRGRSRGLGLLNPAPGLLAACRHVLRRSPPAKRRVRGSFLRAQLRNSRRPCGCVDPRLGSSPAGPWSLFSAGRCL